MFVSPSAQSLAGRAGLEPTALSRVLQSRPRLARQGRARGGRYADDRHAGIAGDEDTATRDAALQAWGNRPAVVFGDLMLAPPAGTKQVCGYRKPADAGNKGTFAGFRRDLEAIYLVGSWAAGLNGTSSVLTTTASLQGGSHGISGRNGHPHAKPLDVLLALIERCPPGTIADPFAGSGSTLVAAKQLGRRAIGVELEEKYCEMAARRLAQDVLPLHVGTRHGPA